MSVPTREELLALAQELNDLLHRCNDTLHGVAASMRPSPPKTHGPVRVRVEARSVPTVHAVEYRYVASATRLDDGRVASCDRVYLSGHCIPHEDAEREVRERLLSELFADGYRLDPTVLDDDDEWAWV